MRYSTHDCLLGRDVGLSGAKPFHLALGDSFQPDFSSSSSTESVTERIFKPRGDIVLRFGIAIVIIVGLSVWCLVRIHREYRHGQPLSTGSVMGVWILYLFHLSTTVAASVVAAWFIPLHPIIRWGAGILLLGLGTGVFVAGIWSFHSFKRMSGLDTSELVTTGIYRWSRNPQNVGWALFLLGIAFLGHSGLALLLTGLFWVQFVIYVPLEEQYLEDVFGEQYRTYKQWSHRYLGPPQKLIEG